MISALTIGKMKSPMMKFWYTHLALRESEITYKGFTKNPNIKTQRIFLKVLIRVFTYTPDGLEIKTKEILTKIHVNLVDAK